MPNERNYHLACVDLEPELGCDFKTQARTINDVKDAFWAHAEGAHDDFKDLLPEQRKRFDQSLTEFLASQDLPEEIRDFNISNRTPAR